MTAEYAVLYADLAGDPDVVSRHGTDLEEALSCMEEAQRDHGRRGSSVYYVIDMDDPERGQMDWDDLPEADAPDLSCADLYADDPALD